MILCSYFILHIVSSFSRSESPKVKLSSSLVEIVELMRDPVKGVNSLNRQIGLPTLTFIAADATTWVCEHVDGAATEVIAVDLLQVQWS